MTRQAIQLGWLPRLHIKQTSQEGYGQIYVGAVNWTLMLVTVGLTLGFRKSDNLAAAYGIAVSLTMLMTAPALHRHARNLELATRGRRRRCRRLSSSWTALLRRQLAKVLQGGYVPLLLAALVYALMWVWHRGTGAVHPPVMADLTPFPTFHATASFGHIARVPGTAVFLTRAREERRRSCPGMCVRTGPCTNTCSRSRFRSLRRRASIPARASSSSV